MTTATKLWVCSGALLALLVIAALLLTALSVISPTALPGAGLLVAIALLAGIVLGLAVSGPRGSDSHESQSRERAARDEAAASQQRYGDLVNGLEAIVWEADALTGQVTFISKQAEAILGYPIERWLREPGMRFGAVHPDDRAAVVELTRAAVARGGNHHAEYRAVAADGRVVWLRDLVYAVKGDEGSVTRLRGVMVDVTAQRQTEESLRESEEQLRQLADTMPQIVWSAQPDGDADYFNLRWYDFTGLQAGEGAKETWSVIVHPDDFVEWGERWKAAVTKGGAFQIECRLKGHKGGAYRWHLCRALPVRSRSGRIVRWYGTCTDIDQQKRTEEALMIADRRKNEFLAVLSHELRNPLAPIRNALHILRLVRLDDPDLIEAREVIDRQVHQLVGIVDDLLDVFRIAHQKMPLQKEPLDLAHLVRQTAEDYRSALESTRLNLNLEIAEVPVWVHGDPRRLAQVVTNLLSNSGKYTNPGDEVTVRIVVDAPNQRATVTVRDTGIGIAPELLPHIFETFIQGEQSIDRQRGGLGLGLPLVKGIIDLHGGVVQMRSAGPGQGTEATFSLPLSQQPKTNSKAPTLTVPSAKQLRILIVEDNQDAAKTLAKLLTRFGHTVAMAHTGTAGVKVAREWRPEVILCDLGLPEMDGYEVATTLRSNPDTALARLIAVSGYGQEEDRRRSEEAGFDLHLTKPVDPVELQRLLAVLKVGA